MTGPHPAPEPGDTAGTGFAGLADLVAGGIEVDGSTQVCESSWVVYGHASYDGEVIVGAYPDAATAARALRAIAPSPGLREEEATLP